MTPIGAGQAEAVDFISPVNSRPRLLEVVREATAALIRMDAERLEELSRCCADLNREYRSSRSPEERDDWTESIAELKESEAELALLGQVVEESRSNLMVLTHVRARRLEISTAKPGSKPGAEKAGAFSPAFKKEPFYGDN